MAISQPETARKELETMYKFKKIIPTAYEKLKMILNLIILKCIIKNSRQWRIYHNIFL